MILIKSDWDKVLEDTFNTCFIRSFLHDGQFWKHFGFPAQTAWDGVPCANTVPIILTEKSDQQFQEKTFSALFLNFPRYDGDVDDDGDDDNDDNDDDH